MTWPVIFQYADRAEDHLGDPRDDLFEFALECWCHGTAALDDDLAYWTPKITALCHDHSRAARGLPLRTSNTKCKRSLAPRLWDLGLKTVEQIQWSGWWRIGFRCGCLFNAALDPTDQHVRPTHVWCCGTTHRGYDLK